MESEAEMGGHGHSLEPLESPEVGGGRRGRRGLWWTPCSASQTQVPPATPKAPPSCEPSQAPGSSQHPTAVSKTAH